MKLIIFNETLIISKSTNFISMVTDSHHREKTFWIEKKNKKNMEYKTTFQSQKYFKIEKTISKSSKMFQNREIVCYLSQ